jgi:hypothetical protein
MHTDDMTRAMFGCHAVHCGFNMIVQDGQDGKILIVGQSQAKAPHPLRFGSNRTHLLLMGDMVFRPHLVIGTDEMRGRGLTNLVTDGFTDMDTWVRGDIVLDPIGKVAAMDKLFKR